MEIQLASIGPAVVAVNAADRMYHRGNWFQNFYVWVALRPKFRAITSHQTDLLEGFVLT